MGYVSLPEGKSVEHWAVKIGETNISQVPGLFTHFGANFGKKKGRYLRTLYTASLPLKKLVGKGNDPASFPFGAF